MTKLKKKRFSEVISSVKTPASSLHNFFWVLSRQNYVLCREWAVHMICTWRSQHPARTCHIVTQLGLAKSAFLPMVEKVYDESGEIEPS